MSDAERQSPRTAIRKWLQVTDNKSTARPANALPERQNIQRGSKHHSRQHHITRYQPETEDQHDKAAGRNNPKYNKNGTRQKHVAEKTHLVNSLQAQPGKHSIANPVDPDGLVLAERLGLHPPFRTFKDHSDGSIPKVKNRTRKRKRSWSSSSSYLEPAAVSDLDNDDDRPSHATMLRTVSTRPALGDRGNNNSHTTSQSSEMVDPSAEKKLKLYERRPRHKTRIDRYELKENIRHGKKTKQDAKKESGKKKPKKHRRKEKSGAALMHDFTAQNVAHNRLTVSCI